jgi:hypothetical protein
MLPNWMPSIKGVAGDGADACYLRTLHIRAVVRRFVTRTTIYSLTPTIL